MLKLGGVTEFVVHLSSARVTKSTKPFINECSESIKECVYKLILVGASGLLVIYVKYFLRNYVAVLIYIKNKVCVLCKMLYRFFGDVSRNFHRENFVHILNYNRRISYNNVEGRKCRLDFIYPLGVDSLAYFAFCQRRRGVGRAEKHSGIIELKTILCKGFEGGVCLVFDFFV